MLNRGLQPQASCERQSDGVFKGEVWRLSTGRQALAQGSMPPYGSPTPHQVVTVCIQKPPPSDKPSDAFAKQTRTNSYDPQRLEPKMAKRIIANRQSAFHSRQKKLNQVQTLEQEIELATMKVQVGSI